MSLCFFQKRKVSKMKIEILKIENLIPYENNAKLHPDYQIEQIKKSIEKFGFNDPIAIDKDNIVIEGHGRLIALKELGYKEVPVIRLDHMTEPEKRAYIIAHNKLTMNTDFDVNILYSEIEEIKNDIDIKLTGFDDINVDDFDTDFELPSGEKEPFQQMTFMLADEQAELIKDALKLVKGDDESEYETFGNQNSNGNALYKVVKQWAEQKI